MKELKKRKKNTALVKAPRHMFHVVLRVGVEFALSPT
jgi:hypothetical protein